VSEIVYLKDYADGNLPVWRHKDQRDSNPVDDLRSSMVPVGTHSLEHSLSDWP